MEISKYIIRYYLNHITVAYFNRHDSPPNDINDYYDQTMSMRKAAIYRGDLGILRLGLDYLLCNQDIPLDLYAGVYPYDDDEIREIIKYVREILYPDAPPPNPEEVKDIELSSMNIYDWWNRTK